MIQTRPGGANHGADKAKRPIGLREGARMYIGIGTALIIIILLIILL
jgi:hypothetical protein